jgi:hypothetical protein
MAPATEGSHYALAYIRAGIDDSSEVLVHGPTGAIGSADPSTSGHSVTRKNRKDNPPTGAGVAGRYRVPISPGTAGSGRSSHRPRPPLPGGSVVTRPGPRFVWTQADADARTGITGAQGGSSLTAAPDGQAKFVGRGRGISSVAGSPASGAVTSGWL